MRRRFAMAVGGCLAVAAVGTAQQAMMTQQPMPATATPQQQYRSPFMVTNQPPATTPMPAMAQPVMQPGMPMMQPGMQAVQYIPVQPVQSMTLPAPQPMHSPAPIIAAPMPDNYMVPAAPPPNVQMSTQSNSSPIQYYSMQPVPTPLATTQPVPGRPNVIPAQPAQPQPIQAPAGSTPPAPLATNGQGCPTVNMNGCGNNGCQPCEQPCCGPCGPDGRFWVSAEYLLWWTQGSYAPPLVTGSPAGTPRSQAGVLGAPGTVVLFGGGDLNDGTRSGFRVRFGGWLDCCRTCGLEASYFFLGDDCENFAATGNILGRPFYNVVNGQQDSELVDYPNVVTGRVSVDSSTSFSGFDVNFRKNLSCDCCSRTDFLVGFRYLKLEDEIIIAENLLVTGTDPNAIPAPGTTFSLIDSFQTQNEFYGPQFGLAGEMRRGSAFVNWRGLIAFGTTHKTAAINGSTTITPPGGPATTYAGGLLALPTNIGNYSKNDFSVVPELNINVGYQVTSNLRVFVGYSFLYWSNVTRAGDIIDTTINPTQLPPGTLVGPARPAFTWNDSDFWAQGVSFGGEFRW